MTVTCAVFLFVALLVALFECQHAPAVVTVEI